MKGFLARLRNSSLPLCSEKVDQLCSAAGSEGPWFYMCTCGRFRHYLWCLHVALKAIADGLIEAPYCPPTLDPKGIGSVKDKAPQQCAGRPAKAKKGGALTNTHG